MSAVWTFEGFHHVQLSMPPGGEEIASAFYADVLKLEPLEKPAHLRARGGCWFRAGGVELHLGVEDAFVPPGRAHAALRVAGLEALREAILASSTPIEDDTQLAAHDRWYVRDPFGNRLELIEER